MEHWHELVPPTQAGLLNYLSSGLLKGIGESTARSIVQRFGAETLDVLEYHPEKRLEVRGITEQKLEEIRSCYAESRAMRDIMELLTPFQVTPVTALKIYQHFGPACTDILRKSPFRLCEISGFGFRRVDAIIRKSGGDPHDPIRIYGAMICALENARQHGHLYLEAGTLIADSLLLLNEPLTFPQMQVHRAETSRSCGRWQRKTRSFRTEGGCIFRTFSCRKWKQQSKRRPCSWKVRRRSMCRFHWSRSDRSWACT